MENWAEQCQIVLEASYGFDFFKFYFLLYNVAKPRIDALKENQLLKVYGDWLIGKKHMLFDLGQVSVVLRSLTSDEDFQNLENGEVFGKLEEKPIDFLRNLENFLS